MRERERSARKKETRIDRRRWSAFGPTIHTMHREVTHHRRTMITSVRRSPVRLLTRPADDLTGSRARVLPARLPACLSIIVR